MIIQFDKLLKINHSPPEKLKSWLNHNSSLTEKLKTLSGEAELQVLKQSWTLPNWWDKFTLGLAALPVIHRDILMHSCKIPCWFARTIIPNDSYQANRSFFDRLEQESLGSIVFNEPNIKRIVLHHYAIDEFCLEYYWLPVALQQSTIPFWTRFSIFSFPDGTCFCLVEILLPGLMSVVK
ncbi:MAG: chorismate lyase [Tatlockia sp.]|nr:chorismate lyase [Tatlockia sp.]